MSLQDLIRKWLKMEGFENFKVHKDGEITVEALYYPPHDLPTWEMVVGVIIFDHVKPYQGYKSSFIASDPNFFSKLKTYLKKVERQARP